MMTLQSCSFRESVVPLHNDYTHYHSLRFFHTYIRWWSFTGVWERVSQIKSAGPFSVFLSILTVLWSRWSRFFLWISVYVASFQRPWRAFQEFQLQLVSLSPSCSSVSFFCSLTKCKYFRKFLSLFTFTQWYGNKAKSN